MNRGYIKLWRKSKDSIVFDHPGIWKLWCLCLMLANHKEIEVMLPGVLKAIKVKPGQFITGRDSLHRAYHQAHIKRNYSRKAKPTAITLYRWLIYLQKCQILSINSYSKYSIITITNWPLYQENEQQVNNRRTTGEHKQELKKNEKEIYGQNFLNYWKEYPNKVAKKKALETWNKLEKREDMKTLLPTLLDAIEKQKQAKESKKTNSEFVPEWPNPATWLNGRRWEDEIEIEKQDESWDI